MNTLYFSTQEEWERSSQKILVIAGVTASGKSSLAIELHERFGATLINGDSLLFFKELNIGTAKPNAETLKRVPHHLVNICSIAQPYNASRFCQAALPVLQKSWSEGRTAILVGGSGFYLQALLFGMNQSKTSSTQVINHSQQLYEQEGIKPFIQLLELVDPATLLRIHHQDHYRLRRACEHWWNEYTPFSQAQDAQQRKKHQSPRWKEQDWAVQVMFLDRPVQEQYQWIEKRTEQMIQQGLINEVKEILQKFPSDLKPLQSIGYKETIQWLATPTSVQELMDNINIHTRQLAKAQRTWFSSWETHRFHPEQDRSAYWNYLEQLF